MSFQDENKAFFSSLTGFHFSLKQMKTIFWKVRVRLVRLSMFG